MVVGRWWGVHSVVPQHPPEAPLFELTRASHQILLKSKTDLRTKWPSYCRLLSAALDQRINIAFSFKYSVRTTLFSSEFMSFRLLPPTLRLNNADWEIVTDVSEAIDTSHTKVLTLRQCRCETRSHTKETKQSEGTRRHVPKADMRDKEEKLTRKNSPHNGAFHEL